MLRFSLPLSGSSRNYKDRNSTPSTTEESTLSPPGVKHSFTSELETRTYLKNHSVLRIESRSILHTNGTMSTSKRDRNVPPGVLNESRRTLTNENTGERIVFKKYAYEADDNGRDAVATIVCQPGGGPPLHYHKSYAERFEAIDGDLGVMLNGKKLLLRPGDKADIPIGSVHRFFNNGDKDITFMGSVVPGHPGFEKGLYILFGLNNDGLADPKTGMPYNILHIALIGEMSDMRFAGFQGTLMNYLTGFLAAYARWRGVEEELLKKYWD